MLQHQDAIEFKWCSKWLDE